MIDTVEVTKLKKDRKEKLAVLSEMVRQSDKYLATISLMPGVSGPCISPEQSVEMRRLYNAREKLMCEIRADRRNS